MWVAYLDSKFTLQKDPLVLFQNKETLISPCLNIVAYESKYTVMSELVYVYTCIPNGGQGCMASASTIPVRITCQLASVCQFRFVFCPMCTVIIIKRQSCLYHAIQLIKVTFYLALPIEGGSVTVHCC